MENLSKIDTLHNHLPIVFNSRQNKKWKALVGAIGQSDQDVVDLIENVRKQFFVKTANRPYIDRLASKVSVQRPRFVGMDDQTFREFIPTMSFSPKQVKIIFDKLIDLFFFKESTTSFSSTTVPEKFQLKDGWTLEYVVDSYKMERIEFSTSDFVDISNATAFEVVSAINRQSKYSYAIPYEDSSTKKVYIRLFTKTIGSKGSICITGGLANISLKFEGFINEAGAGSDTAWLIDVVGDTVSFKYLAGNDPGLEFVSAGDYALSQIDQNSGSFKIDRVDAGNKTFYITSLFSTPGTFTQTSANDLKFIKADTSFVYKKDRRAIVWEVSPREIIVEVPPSPPVVKRSRKGAFHINGVESLISGLTSSTVTLTNATRFPTSGKIILQPVNEIKTLLSNSLIDTYDFGSRFSEESVYSYTDKVGNTLIGVTPALPKTASLNMLDIVDGNRVGINLQLNLSSSHDYSIGEYAIVSDTDYLEWNPSSSYSYSEVTKYSDLYYKSTIDDNTNNQPDTLVGWQLESNPEFVQGTFKILEIISPTSIVCMSFGTNSKITSGTVRVERIGISNIYSKIILKSSILEPTRHGPYMWKTDADFILSSNTTTLTSVIKAGITSRNIEVLPNTIPSTEGKLIIGFGTSKQEGPIRYFFKPSSTSIAIDPAYVFKFSHDIGESVASINRRGGIEFSGLGTEMPPYITDPSAAREILKELMTEVKSVGVFLNFLVRYPKQYYATIDVYKSGSV